MQSMTSASLARLMTESQGWVSPVKTMDLPPLVSRAIGEGVEVGLDVLRGGGGYFPLVGGCDGAGSDVTGVDDGRFSG